MKVLQINTVCGTGSTGRIATDLYEILLSHGHDCFIGYGRGSAPENIKSYRISSDIDLHYHALMTRITDKTGFYSKNATRIFIDKIHQYNPDIIHLHNLHGYYINLEMLFKYLSVTDKPVVWTLHDCWAFTGHCIYFDYIGCEKWKTECDKCPQKKEYPKSCMLDNSKWNYQQKKRLFTSVKNMTIITPSIWLADMVKQSFLKKYPVNVINNGIDLNTFKPFESDFKVRYNLSDKYMILGVANVWDKRKGLNDFIELSKMLDDSYKIVLIGLSEKQIKNLPVNILGLTRTYDTQELVEIYSIADVFVNPSVEETMGLTTVEALACGTPVVVYDATAIPECVDSNVGMVVKKNNIQNLNDSIIKIKKGDYFNKTNCVKKVNMYCKKEKYSEYIELYKQLINS
jgi:glycosyltransferase involved in cell wall biosynthesis